MNGRLLRRTLCFPAATLLVLTVPVVSQAASPSGLVSWWQAEGNANDSADANNGTMVNGAAFGTGHPGQAFSVDNTANQYVSVPDATNLDNMTSITVAAWVIRTSTTMPQHILGKRSESCGENDDLTYQMFIQSDPLSTSTHPVSFGGQPGSGAGGGDVPLNTWTHVAGTYDLATTTWRMYVNGVEVGSHVTTMGVGNITTAPFKIGTSGTCAGFGGLVDEVEIYNRALSAAEIQAIMTPHSTATSVSCSPDTVLAGSPATCSATVSDAASTGQTSPSGTVSFGTSGPGAFSPTNSCTLVAASSSTASCSVLYTPASNGTAARSDTITANYNGDASHNTSDGNTSVAVTSLPTTKDQCKDTGWQNFSVFKNQGDCVSFVATGGKNPPAN